MRKFQICLTFTEKCLFKLDWKENITTKLFLRKLCDSVA